MDATIEKTRVIIVQIKLQYVPLAKRYANGEDFILERTLLYL